MIRFDHVCKTYPNQLQALSDVSFQLHAGEMAFLTGHSGAGKTSLLKLILGIERASKGQIFIQQRNINRIPKHKLYQMRRQIGMVFQNPQLISRLSVADNIALPLHIAGYRNNDIKTRVQAALESVNLRDKQKLLPQYLSTGEQQRAGIARAIINKPPILLADEPTGNLDPTLSQDIMRLFAQFQQTGTSVLIATHDLALIAAMPYRILSLHAGALRGAHSHV